MPGSRAQGWLAQGRSEVLARHGIVATSDPLAAQAGLEILRQGGNAIDAAVATGAVLDVTSQNDTGIGGDLFALVWSARDKKLYALNSGGWAPAGWTPRVLHREARREERPGQRRQRGDGARRDLRLRRAAETLRHDDLQGNLRARRADRRGRLGPGRAPPLRSAQRRQRAAAPTRTPRQTFLVGDQAPDLYSIIRNPGLAKALRLIQKQGRDAFYKGEIAAAIVEKVQANGGVMTASDLAEFESEWVEPISTNYHGYDVFELPPPGQGFAALEMLNILEVCVPKLGMNLATLGPSDPMYWHLMVEAKKLAYADLLARNADPKFAPVPVKELLSKILRGDPVRQDQPERRVEAWRRRRHRRRDDLSHDRRSLGQHGVADPQRVQRLRQPRHRRAVRLRAAQPRLRLLARPEEPEHRRAAASGRSTRSSPAS